MALGAQRGGTSLVEMDSTFPRRFEYDQLSELPGTPCVPHFYFPGASAEGGADGVLVMIRPAAGTPWIGTFAFGHNQGRATTRVLTTPNPNVICVVADGAGYLVSASAPRDWQSVRADPVLDVRQVRERSLLVFADFTDLVAYGASGVVWAVRIGADDLRIVEVSADRIGGTWWNPAAGATVEFVVDPSNGELIGGERW